MSDSVLALVILAVIIVCFAMQKIPIGITALLGAIAMSVFGLISYADAFSGFGSDTVMMVAGMIIMGNALAETGLAEILGKKLLRIRGVAGNERVFLAFALILVTIFGSFLSNTVTVAVFLHLIATVAKASNGVITKKHTYMAVGVTAVIGGNMTLVSSTPQIVAQGILTQTPGLRGLSFFELAAGTIPLVAIVIFYFVTIGYGLQKKIFDFPEVQEDSCPDAPHVREEPTLSWQNPKPIYVLIIFAGCMLGFGFGVLTVGIVAAIGGCLCILTGCISFKRAFATMDWTAILVLGGALGFARAMEQSGAVELISKLLLQLVGGAACNPLFLFAIVVVATAGVSLVTSNTATAAIFTPLAIGLAQGVGANPLTFVVGVIFACNMDFAMPIGSPPITMTLSGGYRFCDYIKVGGLINLIAVAATIVLVPLIYGL